MITLKQLVEEQKWNEMSDIQIIESFFALNNMEEEGLELIHSLTKTKIGKLKDKHKVAETWVSCLPSKYLYENYDLDTADKLHTLEINYLINGGKLSNEFLEWAKENIPNIIEPQVYFRPLVEWMKNKGIVFKGE